MNRGSESARSVAVIGAGISGLACARAIRQSGLSVTIFEKSRGTGGRMAVRRTEGGAQFDHGAQYFTVRNARFRSILEPSLSDGTVQKWNGRIVTLCDGTVDGEKTSCDRFVAVPGMNALCKRLAGDLPIHRSTRAAPPTRRDGRWLLRDEQGQELGLFDVVVVSAPAPQAAELLREAPALARKAASTKMDACWAMMVEFSDRLPLDFDGAFVQQSPLSWIARNGSKPGRDGSRETWVAHASTDWTRASLEKEAEFVSGELLVAFEKAVGLDSLTTEFLAAHRWRFALPSSPLEERLLSDGRLGIAACGDWCGGPRVEGATLSGLSAAERIAALD